MILKVQRPLFSSTGDYTEVLVYDETRCVDTFCPFTPELQKRFGERAKIFVDGSVVDGALEIEREVSSRPW